jgi:sensor histidine kinase YesM
MFVATRGGANGITSEIRLGFQTFRSVSRWTAFLHMAALRTQFTVPIYLCIVCVCWVIGHFQESGERERRTLELEARLSEANLKALKMQLQPHFLFNTLNSISSLTHENPDKADDMIGSLSQLLRATLEVSATNQIPLRRELEFVEHYLEIQQTRFGDRLRIDREIGPDVMETLVPPLILQPLVENALRHGIESRETGGTVTIRALHEGDFLRLEISDDGRGFSTLGAGNGIGLSNAKARLQELYGDNHRFIITANEPTGACVKIEIPFRPSVHDGQKEV